MHEVILPWPPKHLSPNARVHWSVRHKAAKSYKSECYMNCKLAGIAAPITVGKLHLWIDFYASNRRRRDTDNLLSSFKAGIDGISDYLGIDDSNFIFHPFLRDEVIKFGCVKVRITTGPESKEIS